MSGSSDTFTDYLLGELKCASLHTRLVAIEIDSISAALSGNFITPDDALSWLSEAGGLGLVCVSSITLISTAA